MDMLHLRPIITNLLAYVEELPEAYRLSTYTALINDVLLRDRSGVSMTSSPQAVPQPDENSKQYSFAVNGSVRSFFSRTGLTEDELRSYIIVSDGTIQFAKEPPIVPKARATVDWAILLALSNGLVRGEFSVTRREIRRKTTEVGCYDSKNFSTTLRESEKFFNGPFNDEDTKRFLAPAGDNRLVQIIQRLT